MAQIKVSITVSFAWWWPLYMQGVTTIHMLTGLEPDWSKFRKAAYRVMRCRVSFK
jgi:hypothetical protein